MTGIESSSSDVDVSISSTTSSSSLGGTKLSIKQNKPELKTQLDACVTELIQVQSKIIIQKRYNKNYSQ